MWKTNNSLVFSKSEDEMEYTDKIAAFDMDHTCEKIFFSTFHL